METPNLQQPLQTNPSIQNQTITPAPIPVYEHNEPSVEELERKAEFKRKVLIPVVIGVVLLLSLITLIVLTLLISKSS